MVQRALVIEEVVDCATTSLDVCVRESMTWSRWPIYCGDAAMTRMQLCASRPQHPREAIVVQIPVHYALQNAISMIVWVGNGPN